MLKEATWTTLEGVFELKKCNNVQSEAEAVSEDDMMALEMDYGEFCEAIIAIAAWKMPSPFLAFDQRVDAFLSMVLFRNSDKKKKGGKRK